MLVLLFSGMSFVGYIAQRMSGAAGYPLTGLLGGLVSSTSVTLTFARLSKTHPQQEGPLAVGAVAASTVLFLRVAIAVAVLNAALLPVLARYLAAPLIVALIAVALAWRSLRGSKADAADVEEPAAAAERDRDGAALPGGAVRGVLHARSGWAMSGLLASGFVLGLTDVDALTLSMTRSVVDRHDDRERLPRDHHGHRRQLDHEGGDRRRDRQPADSRGRPACRSSAMAAAGAAAVMWL